MSRSSRPNKLLYMSLVRWSSEYISSPGDGQLPNLLNEISLSYEELPYNHAAFVLIPGSYYIPWNTIWLYQMKHIFSI